MDNKKTIEKYGSMLGKTLSREGTTYASIILTAKENVLYSFSTNQKWDKIYHHSGFSKDCHLIQASKKLRETCSNFTLFWDLILPTNEISHYLNHMRNENRVCHGVSFCKKNNNGILEILTLAGRASDFNFSKQVIKNKERIYQYIKGIQSKLWEKKASYFLGQNA